MEWGFGLYPLLAVAVGFLASREFGRSGLGWFFLALVFTPLVGLLLFLLPPRRRPCPFCGELIQRSAVVCRFCNREVPRMDGPAGLPPSTRVLVAVLVLAVLAAALSQCEFASFRWWDSSPPVQVQPTLGTSS